MSSKMNKCQLCGKTIAKKARNQKYCSPEHMKEGLAGKKAKEYVLGDPAAVAKVRESYLSDEMGQMPLADRIEFVPGMFDAAKVDLRLDEPRQYIEAEPYVHDPNADFLEKNNIETPSTETTEVTATISKWSDGPAENTIAFFNKYGVWAKKGIQE